MKIDDILQSRLFGRISAWPMLTRTARKHDLGVHLAWSQPEHCVGIAGHSAADHEPGVSEVGGWSTRHIYELIADDIYRDAFERPDEGIRRLGSAIDDFPLVPEILAI